MKNKKELIIVLVVIAVVAISLFAVLGLGVVGLGGATLLPALSSAKRNAQMAQCVSNLKQLSQANYLYGTMYNGFVTPIAWGDGVNIWPALLWNETGAVSKMPYSDYGKDTDKWLPSVKASHLFECPADKDTASLAKSNSDVAFLSYAINRSAVRNMKSSSNAATIPNGPVLRVTKFKLPSQMIYAADTAWNKSASVSNAPGRLYSTMSHPSYGFKPGSISCPWDQSSLGPEFNGKTGETTPWHVSKSWNYAFIDGHASNLRPEQTINTKVSRVEDREPSGYWTWNQQRWGAED